MSTVPILTFCGRLIFAFGFFEIYLRITFATAPKIGGKYCIVAFCMQNSGLRTCFG